MASCLVPELPAVKVALEHIKQLDQKLKEDNVPFSSEASLHLEEISTAISELEAARYATHEHLEVETIENSKLRHQINIPREKMSQEIMADVAAVRASYEDEMKQLQRELSSVYQLQESTMKRQEALQIQNQKLLQEKEQLTAEHPEIVGALNDELMLKYNLQNNLDQTRERIEELKSSIPGVKQEKITLQQNMVLEREAFSVKKDSLSKKEIQAEEEVVMQKQKISRCRKELESVNNQKLVSNALLHQLTTDLEKLESSLQGLSESRCKSEKQLEEETQKHQELKCQKETLKKELSDLKETFRVAIQPLKEKIATVDKKMEQGRQSRLFHQDSLSQIQEEFKHQQEEENEERVEHSHVSQQLEQSRLQLEERIAFIIKHRNEIDHLEEQISELLEAYTINKRMFEKDQEEICGNVDAEKRNISQCEEEKKRLTELLEESKRMQKENVQKMEDDINSTWRRYRELQEEEVMLHQRQPKCVDADLLTSFINQCAVKNHEKKAKLQMEIEQYITETESIIRSNEEKQKEVEEKEEMLREVEAKWDEEHSRHQRLEAVTLDLRKKKSHLELSTEGLKNRTSSMHQRKEEMMVELEELRATHIDVLKKQASELMAVEVGIYNNGAILRQVNMENSRLHLGIRELTEGISRARKDRDRYQQEAQQLEQKTTALVESLQEAWKEDLLLLQHCQSADGELLMYLTALLDFLKDRKQQLGSIGLILHQQMLEFSKRLGFKAVEDPKS